MKNKIIVLVAILTLILIGTILVFAKPREQENSSKPKIATTIYGLSDIAKSVAGDKVEVVLIIKPGANPHTFDPTPADIRRISGSQIIFAIGHGIDTWTNKLSQAAKIENVVTVDKNVKLLKSSENTKNQSFDPHYWLSPENGALIAFQMKEELSSLFPEHKKYFEENLEKFTNSLEQTDISLKLKLASLPDRRIATFHNAWTYFANHYDIDIVATFEEFPGKEPTPDYIRQFQENIVKNNIKVIFSEPDFPTNALQPVSKDLGITLSTLDPMEGANTKNTYIELIEFNVNQIISALSNN